jgi:hypothetical protein
MLKAHLFGELLNEEALLEIGQSEDLSNLLYRLRESAPDFSPPK